MARVQGREKTSITCDLLIVWQTITNDATEQISKNRENYWKYWTQYFTQ